MKYIRVGKTNELAAASKKKVTIEGKEILLVNIDNVYYAVNNKCPHMGGSLFDGTLDGSRIICPRHGSIFDVTTGKAMQGAKILFFKANVRDIQCYPVKIEGDDLLIGFE